MKSDESRRAIGKLVSVAADRFVVEMHGGTENFTIVGFDDVHYVARIGSFVALPVATGLVIAEVVGMRDNESPSHRGKSSDVKNLDKASSTKFLDLVPVGFLPSNAGEPFNFGVSLFPPLYSDALYVLDSELDRIFDVSAHSELVDPDDQESPTRYRAVTVGQSVVFNGYDVKARIDEFFGGHSAVLGNTGSGKSCTVATILQSLFLKPDEHKAIGATFLILDVNGEYEQAFAQLPSEIKRLHFKVPGPASATAATAEEAENARPFLLPHWFLSLEEWELLLRASERTQQPVLRTALGLTSLFSDDASDDLDQLRNHILASCVRSIMASDAGSPSKKDRILSLLSTYSTESLCRGTIQHMIAISYGELADEEGLNNLLDENILDDITLPGYQAKAFKFDQLLVALELAILYEEAHGNRQIRDYCSQLLTRFCSVRDREDFAFLRDARQSGEPYLQTVETFVEEILGHAFGAVDQEVTQLVLLDLSDTPDEVVEVVASVITRLVFERLRKRVPRNTRPVHLVLEEAHRYVGDGRAGFSIDASKVFERVAKEGRKYGLFLILASQRPSELSATVLSQCSNFIVHRIQNPDDLNHVRQMTPYVSSNVIARLPSLPKQHALIFGSAVNVPTTFRVRDASPRPKSDDARISELWFRGS